MGDVVKKSHSHQKMLFVETFELPQPFLRKNLLKKLLVLPSLHTFIKPFSKVGSNFPSIATAQILL